MSETEPLAPADAGREELALDAEPVPTPPRPMGAAAACAWFVAQMAAVVGG
ncbi:MAG: hypothetical protein ACXWJC_07015 [Croceibacterium sp.]